MANISQTLIDEAKARIADVSARMRATKEAQIAAGETLFGLREQVQALGLNWQDWAKTELDISKRTADRWIAAHLKYKNPTISVEPQDTVSHAPSENTEESPTDDDAPASSPPQSDEVSALNARIAELEQDLVWVREELELQYRVNKSTRKVEPLSKDEYRQLCAAFHPDVNLSPEKRTELSALWNSKASILRP